MLPHCCARLEREGKPIFRVLLVFARSAVGMTFAQTAAPEPNLKLPTYSVRTSARATCFMLRCHLREAHGLFEVERISQQETHSEDGPCTDRA
jgi:hypothetical protein